MSEELDVEADKSDGRVPRPSQCQVTCCLAMRAPARLPSDTGDGRVGRQAEMESYVRTCSIDGEERVNEFCEPHSSRDWVCRNLLLLLRCGS